MKKRLIACVILTIMALNLNIYSTQVKADNNKKVTITNTINSSENINFSEADPDEEDID